MLALALNVLAGCMLYVNKMDVVAVHGPIFALAVVSPVTGSTGIKTLGAACRFSEPFRLHSRPSNRDSPKSLVAQATLARWQQTFGVRIAHDSHLTRLSSTEYVAGVTCVGFELHVWFRLC